MKKYQPHMEFPAHGKNMQSVSKMLWLLESNISDHYPYTSLVVFEAFTIESYLNTLGWESIEFWSELERLPWKKKVDILHVNSGKKANWSQEPLQFATEIFQIRDKLAHGKPEKVKGDFYATYEEAHNTFGTHILEPKWYKKIDKKWILESRVRFDSLMKYLSDISGHTNEPYTSGGDFRVLEIET